MKWPKFLLTTKRAWEGDPPRTSFRRPVFQVNRFFFRYTWGVILWIVAAIVFVLNLPFGYWRSRARRFSAQWILAIHLPVPLVIACRILSGLGWHFITFPVIFGAFFLGQFVGGKIVGSH